MKNWYKVTLFKNPNFIFDGKIKSFLFRVEKVSFRDVPEGGKACMNSGFGEFTRYINSKASKDAMVFQGYKVGPQTLAGIEGEKTGIVAILLDNFPNVRELAARAGKSFSENPEEMLSPDYVYSPHSCRDAFGNFQSDITVYKSPPFLGINSTQEFLELSEVRVEAECKNYQRSPVEKAAESAANSKWLQTLKSGIALTREDIDSVTVQSLKKSAIIMINNRNFEKAVVKGTLAVPEGYEDVMYVTPADEKSVQLFQESCRGDDL